MLIYLTSTDGQSCMPLTFYATKSMTAQWLCEKVSTYAAWVFALPNQITDIRNKLKEGPDPLIIEWGSTDGWTQCEKFRELMRKVDPSYLHIYVNICSN